MDGRHYTYQGQHRLWHVLDGAPDGRRIKVSEPREGVLWFDRRCFPAEEPLLRELAELGMTRLPAVRSRNGDPGGERGTGGEHPLLVQDFIDGTPLAEVAPTGTPLAPHHLHDVIERFRQLASVRVRDVRTERTCTDGERASDGDTRRFFETLVAFTRERGHHERRPTYGPLFDALGVPRTALAAGSSLANEAKALTPRPFCLLHGDLHRANFVIDEADGGLWTIDWELAMLGDPLYDLATHLYLMHYPDDQRREVIRRWRRAVTEVLPQADDGWRDDLPRYLAYKRAQSVFTDVVRHAQKLAAAGPEERARRLPATAETVHALLRRAADVLEPAYVPQPEDVAAAYRNHLHTTAAGSCVVTAT